MLVGDGARMRWAADPLRLMAESDGGQEGVELVERRQPRLLYREAADV